MNAADALPGPGQFCGRDDENGQSWLENFELWLQFRGINGERKAAALALLLKDKAAAWYQSLPADKKNTFNDLRASFAERYGRARLAQWQQAGLVWTLEQQQQQSVDDFIAAVTNAARNAGLTDEQRMQVIIKGLRPSIRQWVLRQQPANIEDLRVAAKMAEQTELPPTTTSNDDVVASVARLEEQLKQLTVAAFSGARYPERSSTPPPRRDTPPPPRQGIQSDNYYFRNRRVPSSERRHVTFNNHAAPPQANARRPCDSCGRNNHARQFCRHRGATCTICRRIGHVASACRSVSRRE